ncbi:endonuclease domain-containing protein [Microbacterium sp. NPDC056044]|uniref:endonuclease domain-containing protein n=1 Tax=Microbacterium sp. NPDC056044 TaxID=3345690 RepID=UPI0035DB0AE7
MKLKAEQRTLALLSAVSDQGGIVRRVAMVKAGHAQRTIETAIAGGLLRVVRRVWVAVPSVDPLILNAARAGVVISCVTRARRLGLWIAAESPDTHVAAHPHAGRVALRPGVHLHRAAPVIPRDPAALEDSLENALALVCACQPFEPALAIVESALNKGLVQKPALLRLPFTPGVRRVIEVASPYSDSGLETFVVPRLRWMKLRIVAQAWIAGHRVDFLIGERLVLQIDGGHHVGRQRASDNAHDAVLRHMGYHVIRVGFIQVTEDWPGVQALIMQAVAQGLHLAPTGDA